MTSNDHVHFLPRDISWRLYKLTFLMGRLAEQTLQEKADLTFSQYRLLMALHHRRALSQKTVAQFHGLTEAAVSRTIDLLVKRKLIVRQANPANRREHLLLLTPSGERQGLKAHTLLKKTLDQLYHSLSRADQDRLSTLLDRLLGAMWTKGKRIMCGPRGKLPR